MYRSGTFVAEHVEPTTDEQVQPSGVDLTLEAVYEQCEPGQVMRDGKAIGDRTRLSIDRIDDDDDGDGPDAGVYTLRPGGYVVEYGEVVSVPDGHVGFVYPRSSLLRNSCMLDTAVWDAGYEGRGEGLLEVHHRIDVEAGARIAQFVLAGADHYGTYDGSYQHENL